MPKNTLGSPELHFTMEKIKFSDNNAKFFHILFYKLITSTPYKPCPLTKGPFTPYGKYGHRPFRPVPEVFRPSMGPSRGVGTSLTLEGTHIGNLTDPLMVRTEICHKRTTLQNIHKCILFVLKDTFVKENTFWMAVLNWYISNQLFNCRPYHTVL